MTESAWADLRSQYLNSPDETYLNTGSWGVMPRPVFDQYIARLRELELNPTRNRGPLREKVQTSRRELARFLNIQAEDLAFLPNVTVAINVVVNGLNWQEGDEILTTDQEYGAILNCLHNASMRWKVTVVKAKIPVSPEHPSDILDALEAAFSSRTRLVVCSHITTRTGMIMPIREIAQLAHDKGALSAFDGAHAPGMIPLDLANSGADFYGGNCHKWLCSPKGVGFLYANPSVQSKLRHLIVGWGYDRNGSKCESGQLKINGGPFMWGIESWGTTDLAAQSVVGEAVRFQTDIGIEQIAARGRDLSAYLRSKVDQISWAKTISPAEPGMFGSITSCSLEGLGGMGLSKRIYEQDRITMPIYEENDHCMMRVSTHLYNTHAEIDHLIDSIKKVRAQLS